jgi:hypothetical protein
VSPSSYIQDSKVMDILLDCLKDGGPEIVSLMNHLPTAPQVVNRLRAIPRKVHRNLSEWLSAEHPGYCQYVLSTIAKVRGLANDIIEAGFLDCVLETLTTATNTSVIHQLLLFLDSHLQPPLFERYATKAFLSLAALVCANMREDNRWLLEYALCLMTSFSGFVSLANFGPADGIEWLKSASFKRSPNWAIWDGCKLDRDGQQDAAEFCLMLIEKLLASGGEDIHKLFQVQTHRIVHGVEEKFHVGIFSFLSELLDSPDSCRKAGAVRYVFHAAPSSNPVRTRSASSARFTKPNCRLPRVLSLARRYCIAIR